MPTRGRKPKPTEVKRKLGNPGKRQLPNGSALAAVPALPAELHELDLGACVERITSEGVVWLASTDAPTLVCVRDAIEDYNDARACRDYKMAMELRKQIASLLSELGFSPSSRARLGLAEVKAAESTARLDQIRDRHR